MAVNRRQRIVVLGGGIGGVAAASALARRLGGEHDVLLVDRRREHVYSPGLLSVMTGSRTPQQVTRSLDTLRRRDVSILHGEVESIEPARQEVRVDDRPVSYDHLVIALGMEPTPEAIPGFAEAADHAWTLDAAVALRRKLATFDDGRVVIGIPSGAVPCLPAAYEMTYLLHDFLVHIGMRGHIPIELFTRDQRPRGADHDPAVFVDQMARRRGIITHYEFVPEAIDAERKIVRGSGIDLSYDLLVFVPPHAPAHILLDSHLADTIDGVRVDWDTLETRWENVYAIGDCADVPAPKAALVAFQEAQLVAHNIDVKIRKRADARMLKIQSVIGVSFGSGKASLSRTTYPYGWPPLGGPSGRATDPSTIGHWTKAAFEKWWLWRYFS